MTQQKDRDQDWNQIRNANPNNAQRKNKEKQTKDQDWGRIQNKNLQRVKGFEKVLKPEPDRKKSQWMWKSGLGQNQEHEP